MNNKAKGSSFTNSSLYGIQGVVSVAFYVAMESLLKNLKKHVECSICLDNFKEPKTIACLHTFCCECLKKHALMSRRDGHFLCPNARHKLPFPKETGLISYRLVSSITACSVFSLFNKAAMEMISLADFARRRRTKQAIVSNAKKCCAATV